MFLAHFSNTSLTDLMEWPVSEIIYWYNEAVKTHNHLNRSDE